MQGVFCHWLGSGRNREEGRIAGAPRALSLTTLPLCFATRGAELPGPPFVFSPHSSLEDLIEISRQLLDLGLQFLGLRRILMALDSVLQLAQF
jgi:hypothetical protein